MFGLFSTPTPAQVAREKQWQKEEMERRLPLCVPWDPKIKFDTHLNIKADTYLRWDLFADVKPARLYNPHQVLAKGSEYYKLSDNGLFLYAVQRIPKGAKIITWYGRQRGDVMFDGDVHIPVLYLKEKYWAERGVERWEEKPWMSTTPMEILTLRGGTKLAKGHTVIAGLGLGYQLCEVTHRKKVHKVTLVEIDQGLVDMILPALKDKLGPAPLEVLVGDAHKIVPTLTADVALIDIFHGYGGNDFVPCPNIPRVWCWGSQFVNGSNSLWG